MPRILALLLSVFILLSSSSKIALAQSASESASFQSTSSQSAQLEETQKKDDSYSEFELQYLKRAIGVVSFLHMTSCILIGERCWGKNVQKYTPEQNTQQQILHSLYKDGLLGMASNVMILVYSNPPSSLSFAIGDFLERFIPVSKTYAQYQGIGITSLSTYSSFWSANRNIAYILIILALIIVSFMLIFQYKIDPHTSIDLEKTIVRTAFVILGITFSFAIAGLLIDIMYLSIFAISSLAVQNRLVDSQTITTIFTNANPESLYGFLSSTGNISKVVDSLKALIPTSIYHSITRTLRFLTFFQVAPFLSNTIADLIQTPLGSAAGAIAGTIIASSVTPMITNFIVGLFLNILIGITFLLLYFKIIFLLIASYIEVVIETIFAPYFLLFDILPGKSKFFAWLRRFSANLITFPLLFLLLLTGAIISQTFTTLGTVYLPPPLLTFNREIMGNIISIGILISIPGIIDKAKHAIHPQPMLVNFPQTPAALFGTAATLLPFIPHLFTSVGHTVTSPLSKIGKGRTTEKQPGPKISDMPNIPHVPHG